MAINSPLNYMYIQRVQASTNAVNEMFNPHEDFTSGVVYPTLAFGALTSAFQGGAWIYSNRHDFSQGWKNTKAAAISKRTPKALKAQGTFWSNPFTNSHQWQRLGNLQGQIINKPIWDQKVYDALETEAAKEKFKKQHAYKYKQAYKYKAAKEELQRIKDLASKGKLHGKELKNALNNVQNMIYKADLSVYEDIKAGKLKPTGTWKKAMGFINRKTGMNWLNRQFLKAATKEGNSVGSKALRGFGKTGRAFMKGGGPLTFAIEMGIQVPEIVKTYNKLGAGKGTKQLAKSTVVAGASTAGFIAGAKVGGILGAKAGMAIGTLLGPGIGTTIGGVVGGIIGIGCGIAGSYFAGKAAKAVVGPSELEKAENKEKAEERRAAMTDSNKVSKICADALINQATGKIQMGNQTIEALEYLIKGREEEVNQMVESKLQELQTEQNQQPQQLAYTA